MAALVTGDPNTTFWLPSISTKDISDAHTHKAKYAYLKIVKKLNVFPWLGVGLCSRTLVWCGQNPGTTPCTRKKPSKH